MKELEEFNKYCKENNIKCVAAPIGAGMCQVSTPKNTRQFTIDALRYKTEVLNVL